MSSGHIVEADVLKEVLEYLKSLEYTHVIRINDNHKRGIPDILMCYYGFFVALELKRPGGEPSKHQEKFIDKTIAARGYGGVCESLNDVKKELAFIRKREGSRCL